MVTWWQNILPGFFLGALSGFHCIGMCGAIALTLPLNHLSGSKRIAGAITYNMGRVITYTALGTIIGLAGKQIQLAGFQQPFSIVVGTLVLILALPLFPRFRNRFGLMKVVTARLQNIIVANINKHRFFSLLLTGMANGLLPCGMVYVALAASSAAGSVLGSVGFMAAFGAGTLPLMLLLSFSSASIGFRARRSVKKAAPYFIGFMGAMLILRGLNLGIPFVSPSVQSAVTVVPCMTLP